MGQKVYIRCVEIGDGATTSVFSPIPWQIEEACNSIRADPAFMAQPVNIIGFSQGSLISRGVVEACPDIKVRKLITYGGPHGGVSSIYACYDSIICHIVNFLAK